MRKLVLAAVMVACGSTAAFAQFGPGGPDGPGFGPPPPPPGYDRGPPPPPGFRPPPRRCFIADTPRGPRRVCRAMPPPPPRY